MDHDLEGAFARCRTYIVAADVWYATDILAERVPGPALVTDFQPTLALLATWCGDPSRWVRRAVGVSVQFWAKRARGAAERIAERLFLKTYDLELEEARDYRIWAYRRAAWTVDEWPEPIGEIYRARGEAGLRELPGIGRSLAGQIGGWLREGGVERAASGVGGSL